MFEVGPGKNHSCVEVGAVQCMLKAHRKCPVPHGELVFEVGPGKNHS